MDLLIEVKKIQEAYAIRHNIPVKRQFTDDELREANLNLDVGEVTCARIATEAEIGT